MICVKERPDKSPLLTGRQGQTKVKESIAFFVKMLIHNSNTCADVDREALKVPIGLNMGMRI